MGAGRFRLWSKVLRIPQWVKNLLVFLPLAMSHQITSPRLLGLALLAFAVFSVASSSAYIVNDLHDLEVDRHHLAKRHRPFAAGTVPLRLGFVLAPLLALTSLAAAWWGLPRTFSVVLALYIGLAISYSFYFKKILFLDVLVLAGLYCIRIIAGGIATATFVSPWLLAFSMFFFLSLALVKRYTELRAITPIESGDFPSGRAYLPVDAELLRSVGPVSGYLSVLVLALYINSEAARMLYDWPLALWLTGPLLIYWITRIWLLAHRGELDDDPVLFATRDPVTYLVGALLAAILFVATVGVAP